MENTNTAENPSPLDLRRLNVAAGQTEGRPLVLLLATELFNQMSLVKTWGENNLEALRCVSWSWTWTVKVCQSLSKQQNQARMWHSEVTSIKLQRLEAFAKLALISCILCFRRPNKKLTNGRSQGSLPTFQRSHWETMLLGSRSEDSSIASSFHQVFHQKPKKSSSEKEASLKIS